MRVILFLLLIVFCAGDVRAQIKNQKLGGLESGVAGARVAISPRNNKYILAYGAGKIFVSGDGGATWNTSALQLPANITGTPNLTIDSKGNFFVIYSTLTQLISHSSTNNGESWSEPVIIPAAAGRDHYNPAITASTRKEELVLTWTQAGKAGSEADTCKAHIMLSVSSGGKKWSKPIVVNQNPGNCRDEDFTPRGSSPVIAADGKKFVVWANHGSIFYDRSYEGNIWISTDLSFNEQVGGWTLTKPGFGKMANTPSAAVDNSASRLQGTLFVTFSDQRSGEDDNDIWLMRSVNRGDNWTAAARVNQDKPGREQFLPRISVDPSSGFVYIVYYDRRDYTDSQTDVYIAWSVDGGNQFKEKKITEKPFIPEINAKDYMIDYIDLSVQKGIIVPVWTGFANGKQELWTTVIKQEELK